MKNRSPPDNEPDALSKQILASLEQLLGSDVSRANTHDIVHGLAALMRRPEDPVGLCDAHRALAYKLSFLGSELETIVREAMALARPGCADLRVTSLDEQHDAPEGGDGGSSDAGGANAC